jgi:hypothetical protein
MVHVIPPFVWVLLVNEVLSQFLLYESLAFFDHSKNHVLAISLIIETVIFSTVYARNCRIVHCKVYEFLDFLKERL